jgi:V/A-type H+-transporting ATPase subunit C
MSYGERTGERGSNPEYVNARARSRKAKLFDEEEYGKLVRMGTGEIARFMEETHYEREVNELGSRHAGVDLVEYALNHNMARDFDDLLRWADGSLYAKIARYLRKFDAWNVKTVLRGVYSGADREAVETDLIRAGEFDDTLLDQLVAAGSVEEVVDRLADTQFGEPLAAALPDFEETGLLVPLENAVDRTFYEGLVTEYAEADRATQLYVEFLRAEIDFRNVLNALRIARSEADLDPTDYFIEGGELFSAPEVRQLARNTDELVAAVRESKYGDQLTGALDMLGDADSLIGFERALEAALLEYSDHLSHVYPLSVCPVLAYVLAKEREVENVRAIARGREAGMSETEIEEELVLL